MFVNFFDIIVYGSTTEEIISRCKAVKDLDLTVVRRAQASTSDVYALRGAVHTGYAVSDGESYAHIWSCQC